ncbi:MAG: DUF2325 domain-containing protein [Oscillospiraceae bacterium]
MSVVIVGGNECMAGQYESICREHGCKAKVYTKQSGSLKKKVGTPDLLILFISTVSHKMALSVIQEARRNSVPVARVHTSSSTALRSASSRTRRHGLRDDMAPLEKYMIEQ